MIDYTSNIEKLSLEIDIKKNRNPSHQSNTTINSLKTSFNNHFSIKFSRFYQVEDFLVFYKFHQFFQIWNIKNCKIVKSINYFLSFFIPFILIIPSSLLTRLIIQLIFCNKFECTQQCIDQNLLPVMKVSPR